MINNFGTPFDISYLEETILLKLTKMKKLIITSVLAVMVALGTTAMAQDNPKEYLGLPGDNLNLYAVMKLFQESKTLEDFEKGLNDENNHINNLDLNGDNETDYLTVSDNVDGDVHTIVLRDMLNKTESQDVAVFTVQRFDNGSVQIQLIGDEALYGKNYIIEPIYSDNGQTPNPGYNGAPSNNVNVTVVQTTPYEISTWPLIRFIYLPSYRLWHSSWYWGYYPTYWHPWRPFYWDYYYGYQHNRFNDYYAHYRRWDQFRYPRYNDFYYRDIRAHSPEVSNRMNEGRYKDTYSHPEQRKEGEDFYSKMNPGQNYRRQDNREMNNQGGRSVSQPTRERSNFRNQSQPGNSVTNRSVNRTEQMQRNSTSPAPSQRSATNPAQTQRSAIRSEQSQKPESVRQSRQTAPRQNSSVRSSRRESKPVSSGKRSGKAKESKSGNDSRRK
jgi:hypothetical protein